MSKSQKAMSQARLHMNRMSRHKLTSFYSRFVKVRQEIDFLSEWGKLCFDLGVSEERSGVVGEILVHQYTQPHRKYHDIQHIEDCLALLQACPVGLTHKENLVLRFALFMHDAVYDTWTMYDTWVNGNEERSIIFAHFCAYRLGLIKNVNLPGRFIDQVEGCINATKHKELVEDRNQQLCADVDLFGMSCDRNTFIANERKVREEYFWATDKEFAVGNSAILSRLISRPSIYQTQWFQDKFESVARANITRLLQERGS